VVHSSEGQCGSCLSGRVIPTRTELQKLSAQLMSWSASLKAGANTQMNSGCVPFYPALAGFSIASAAISILRSIHRVSVSRWHS